MVVAQSFVIEVIQELTLALGIALAGANAWALLQSRRHRTGYERALAVWNEQRQNGKSRINKPEEPQRAKIAPAVMNIVIGVVIALLAAASLTYDWIT